MNLLFICMCGLVSLYVPHEFRCLQSPEEGIGSPRSSEARVTDGCELCDMDSRNET